MKKGLIILLAFVTIQFISPIAFLAYADDHSNTNKTEQVTAKDSHADAEKEGKDEHKAAAHTDADAHGKKDGHADKGGHGHHPTVDGTHMSLLWVIPFVGILLSIAVFPLVAPHFWHHHYGKISLFWGVAFFAAFTAGYGPNISFFYLVEVYLLEFISFITLLLALYTVSGGIRFKGELVGTPLLNAGILLVGTLLASWMGTTGAAMLLIRPLIRANSWRKYKTHVVVFFIFLVANIGGSLTPLGDPPLFLGFLNGVSFFWTTKHMLLPMLFTAGILLVVFYIMDTVLHKKEPNKPERTEDGEKLGLEGKWNLLLFPLVVAAVLISSLDLGKLPPIHHVKMPVALLIQVLMLVGITILSLVITKKEIRKANEFTWEPILEVAKLFATIFITMQPALIMLRAGQSGPLGAIIKGVINESTNKIVDSSIFWATGILSSFLDNAPTYVVFFNTAGSAAGAEVGKVAAVLMADYGPTLLAVSAGAVFMGANTYIGNAPNFMVKSIAEESGVPMPSFFGYMFKYSLIILIPTYILVTLVFF